MTATARIRGIAVDMRIWLRDLGLEHYADLFAENHITEGLLDQLTNADLKELGI